MITFSIPCFQSNMEFLNQAIQSVREQSSPYWKLLIVDGNVKQHDELIALVYELNDERISYVRNDQDRSMAGNWNFAFNAASTEFVVLLHDDDYLASNYVKEMTKLINNKPNASMFFCDVNVVNELGRSITTLPDTIKKLIKPNSSVISLQGDKGLSMLLKGCFIFCPTCCYKKGDMPSFPFSSRWKMVTDFQIYFDLLFKGKVLIGTNKKLYFYRRHKNNQTVILTKNFKRFEEEVCFYNVVNLTIDASWSRSKKASASKAIIKFHLIYVAFKNMFSLRFSNLLKCLKFIKNYI